MDHFSAPRDDLIRMVKGELRTEGDGNTLVGYFIRYNKPTIIDSWEGKFREIIAPGAAARTLKNNANQVKVLFNHGMDPSIGDKPLGKPSVIREDEKGVWAEVPLSDTSYNQDIRALLRDGALDGGSFRFSVPTNGDTWEYPKTGLPTRSITEFKLHEFGPVTFPAYAATTAGVRSREEFSLWRTLPEQTQAQLFQVMTATRSASPALGTDDEQLGEEEDSTDPDSIHSSVTLAQRRRDLIAARFSLIRGDLQ